MTKAEMILKLVMAPTMKHCTSFIEQFLKLLPDSDMSEFQKILEMKVKMIFYLEIFTNFSNKFFSGFKSC